MFEPERILWVRAKSLQSYPTLCDPMNCSPPGFPVHGILPTRTLEWVAISLSKGSSWPRDWTHVFRGTCTAGRFFNAEPPGKPSLGLKKFYEHRWEKWQMFEPHSTLKKWQVSDLREEMCKPLITSYTRAYNILHQTLRMLWMTL